MIAALTTEQWQKILKAYFVVLKPGGYLKILEIDVKHIDGGL